jgi:hypothetical protein
VAKLDPRVKGLICEALRSGEFPQGDVLVYADGKFCVGGVIMSVYLRDTAQGEFFRKSTFTVDTRTEVEKWLGIHGSGCNFGLRTIDLNRSLPFSEIADVIERDW